FRTFHNCVQAAKAYVDYWDFQSRYESPFADMPTKPSAARRKAQPLLAGDAAGKGLSEHSSKELVRAYGIRTTKDVLATSAKEAVRAADELGYPVVLKVSSPDLLHKSDAGLVRIGVGSATEVRRTYTELLAAAAKADKRATIEGVLVCEQVTGGVE